MEILWSNSEEEYIVCVCLCVYAIKFINGLGAGYDEVEDSGTRTSLQSSYEDLVCTVTNTTPTGRGFILTGSATPPSTPQLMVYAIDVELALVEHLLKISNDTGVSKENRYKARYLAADLARKIAMDYRNLCVISNDPATLAPGSTPVFVQTVNGVDVITSKPTSKNLYQIFKYVNDNYTTIRSAGTSLTTDHSAGKTLPKDSVKNIVVRTKDFGRRINPIRKKKLDQADRDMFGRLHRSDKTGLIITASAVGLAVAISVTAAVSNFVGKDKTSEETTGVEDTMAPEDTAINNPALDGLVTEGAPETNNDGEVETPEPPQYDTTPPAVDRDDDDYGFTPDFANPNENGDEFLGENPAGEYENTEEDTEEEDKKPTSNNDEDDDEEVAGRA